MATNNTFDPTKLGAKPVATSTGGFDPTKMGAVQVGQPQTTTPPTSTKKEPGFWASLAGSVISPYENLAAGLLNKTTDITDTVAKKINPSATPGPRVTTGVFGNELNPADTPREIIGDSISAAAGVYGGGKAAVATGKGILGKILPEVKMLAKEGAIATGGTEVGQQIKTAENVGDAVKDVAIATGEGAIAGPILGKILGKGGQIVRGAYKAGEKAVGKIVDPVATYTKSAMENINKAIPITRMVKPEKLRRQQEKSLRALTVLSDNSPNITVPDMNESGILEKPFNPAEATFIDTNEALVQTKKKLWNEIQTNYKNATGQELKVDIDSPYVDADGNQQESLYSKLEDIIKDKSNATEKREHAVKLLDELTGMADQDGYVDVAKLGNYNTDLNRRAAPGFGNSNALGTRLDADVAVQLSDLVDRAFDSINMPGFRKLKDDYSSLKSVEIYLVNEAKKEIRQLDNRLASMLGDVGTSEMLSGIISAARGDFIPLAKGGFLKVLSNYRKNAGDRSNFLRKAFEDLDKVKASNTQRLDSQSLNMQSPVTTMSRTNNTTYNEITPITNPSATDSTMSDSIPFKSKDVNSDVVDIKKKVVNDTQPDELAKEIQGKPLYHGTQAPEFDSFDGITYLTSDPREAKGFAEGVHLGGKTGGSERVVEATHEFKKIKNIDDQIMEMLDGDMTDVDIIKRELEIAKKEGYDALSFTHPSNYNDGEFTAYVPVDNNTIKIKKYKKGLPGFMDVKTVGAAAGVTSVPVLSKIADLGHEDDKKETTVNILKTAVKPTELPKEYDKVEAVKTKSGDKVDAYKKDSQRYKYFEPIVAEVEKKIKDEYGQEMPKGMLMALLMKESSLGGNDRSYNDKIGESAWLAGLTNSAKETLKKKGKGTDFDSVQGAVESAARYLMERRIHTYPDMTKRDLIDDPGTWYVDKYYGFGTSTKPFTEKQRKEAKDKFLALVDYYK